MIVTHKRNKTQTTELITIAMNRKKKGKQKHGTLTKFTFLQYSSKF